MTISILSNLFSRTYYITNNNFMGDMKIDDMIRFVKENNFERIEVVYPKNKKASESADVPQVTTDASQEPDAKPQ